MSRVLICTVGTSLLSNRDDRPWAGWSVWKKVPLPDEKTVADWMRGADPAQISAETNTLGRLDLSSSDILVLLHSDTPEGRFCAERLEEYYAGKVRELSLEEVGKLGYGARHFTQGLKALVDIAIRRVREARERGFEAAFCATGGFKAEIAFLNVIGALLGVDVYYIHEKHRELVHFPRLPLTWDAEFVTDNEDFFRWIDDEPRRTVEVESWLKSRPELRSLVESGEDGCTYLSAAGDLLYKAAAERRGAAEPVKWPESVSIPPQEKVRLSGVPHHRPQGWEHCVNRLAELGFVKSIAYAGDNAPRRGPRVGVSDSERGVFLVRCEDGRTSLPLRVETTARGERQCELVAGWLRRMF